MTWLSSELKQEVREVFETRYNRTLSDDEVIEIAENLTGLTEAALKFRWRQKYEKKEN